MNTENYLQQNQHWPKTGKHIMAQFDEQSIVVYQAYNPRIAEFATKHQHFGGDFKYSRMSWIKPNFLWMMYRCGWNAKEGQEQTLAIHLNRAYFDRILKAAHPSSCPPNADYGQWKEKLSTSEVRLQWDPDHCPFGSKQDRKAIQLGLRGRYLQPFQGEGIVKIENITNYVKEQYTQLNKFGIEALVTPKELIYPVCQQTQRTLGMESAN